MKLFLTVGVLCLVGLTMGQPLKPGQRRPEVLGPRPEVRRRNGVPQRFQEQSDPDFVRFAPREPFDNPVDAPAAPRPRPYKKSNPFSAPRPSDFRPLDTPQPFNPAQVAKSKRKSASEAAALKQERPELPNFRPELSAFRPERPEPATFRQERPEPATFRQERPEPSAFRPEEQPTRPEPATFRQERPEPSSAFRPERSEPTKLRKERPQPPSFRQERPEPEPFRPEPEAPKESAPAPLARENFDEQPQATGAQTRDYEDAGYDAYGHGKFQDGVISYAQGLDAERGIKDGRLQFSINGQQGPNSYRFGYDTGYGANRVFRIEEKDGYGIVHGRYGYYDSHGKLRIVNYTAHPEHGFSAEGNFGPKK